MLNRTAISDLLGEEGGRGEGGRGRKIGRGEREGEEGRGRQEQF